MHEHLRGILLLAQGGQFTDDDWFEVVVYTVVATIAAVGLVVVSWYLKSLIAAAVRKQRTPFGMDTTDITRMKDRGALTEEEAKAVRAAMSRQVLERTRAEEEARKKRFSPEVDLEEMKQAREASRPALERMPPTAAERPEGQPSEAKPPPPPREDPLPEHLRPLRSRPLLELEEMCQAGLLSVEDMQLLMEYREP